MLELYRAGCKKALSSIIIIILLVALALITIPLLYKPVKSLVFELEKSSVCSIKDKIEIKEACYLNKGEIKLKIIRSDIDIISILISFVSDTETKYRILDKRCIDMKMEGKRYGEDIRLLGKESTREYIFNVSDLDKKSAVKLEAEIGKEKTFSCFIQKEKIKDAC